MTDKLLHFQQNPHFVPRIDSDSPFQILKDFFSHNTLKSSLPKTDIKETKSEFIISLDVPGFDKKDLQINFNKNLLQITGTQKSEESKEGEFFTYKERQSGSFERTFDFTGKNIDNSKPSAKLENGVLNISLKKNLDLPDKNNQIEIN
jgi:HSP20 family protein